MIGFLQVAFFFAAAAAALSFERSTERRLREALLVAAVLWGVWVVLGTEALSLGGGLRWWPVALWWAAPTVALAALAARNRAWVERVAEALRAMPRPDRVAVGLLAAVGLVLLATGIVAAMTPPNNWDSMVYHMPRQVHWMQAGSVAHYAAPDLRQVMMPPMAEFAGLHFMILTGGDAWANLIQWFALAMTALTASLLARELGAAVRGQSLAALLVVANPMAAMQAMNPKNDLVVSLWACAMAYFVLTVWTRRGCGPGRAALIGAALGLMVLTKGTGYIVGLPISLAAAAAILSVQRWRGLLMGAAIGAIALAINGGHFARNIQEFGAPLGPPESHGQELSNDIHSPAAVTSNMVRNLAIHSATPWNDVNRGIESLIVDLHTAMGLDTNDPRTTYRSTRFTVFRRHLSEDAAGAPLHLALAAPAVLLLALRRRRLLFVASLVPFAAFVAFCVILKWQPWHARLHLPIVCMFAPVAATLLEGVWRGTIAGATAPLALVVLAPSLLWGQQKPLLGSPSMFAASWEENVLRARPTTIQPLREVIEACRDLEPERVAIMRTDPEWTYPFQRALLREMDRPPRFVSISKSPAQRTDYKLAAPDLVLHTDGRALWMGAHGTRYVAAAYAGQYTVYVPREVAQRHGLDPAPPAFIGWNNSKGLDRLEGPHPQWDLPQVRWGLGPATTLHFASDGEATTLILDARQHGQFGQAIVVRLNGQEVGRHTFGEAFAFEEVRLPLAPRGGINELVIEYSDWDRAAPRAVALLYRRLQILPQGLVERGGRGGSGPR